MENVVEIFGKVKKEYSEIAERVCLQALKFMKQPAGLEVAITFVSEREIQRINREFRGVDRVTDVLSFPSTNLRAGEIFDVNSQESNLLKNEVGLIHFGDIAVCSKKITEQAKEYLTSPEAELKKLIIHSTLHLMGYDHIKDSDYEVMKEKEECLDKMIK